MQCKSASSTNTDAYRAGAEIGKTLCEVSPEVILLFASITYEEDFGVFFEGLYDELGTTDLIIFGGTGDGIYETERIADYGISALGMNTGGKVSWSVACAAGTRADSYASARNCALRINNPDIGFALVLADGISADGTRIVDGIESVLSIPFWGGLTGDDRNFIRGRIFLNGQILQDSVAILAADKNIVHTVSASSGWTPSGATGRVEDARGNTVFRISGQSAQEFVKEQLGKPLGETDLGTIPFATYRAEGDRHFFLRAPSHFDPEKGSITTFGSIAIGTPVRICTASAEDIINSSKETLAHLPPGFVPSAAVVVSCAGRKWMVQNCPSQELEILIDALGRKVPLIGFSSFGEISPFRKRDGSYTPTFFHNVTIAVCLLGSL